MRLTRDSSTSILSTVDSTMRGGTDKVRVGTSLPRMVNQTRVLLKISLAESFALFPTNVLHSQPNPHEPPMHNRWPIALPDGTADADSMLLSLNCRCIEVLNCLALSMPNSSVWINIQHDPYIHSARSSALSPTFCKGTSVTRVST